MSFLERFKAYLDKQFRLVPMSKEAAELRESMLGDLMSRAMDLKQSKAEYSDDEIYTRCIDSLGDYTAMLNELRLKPLDTVKSPRFQRGVLASLSIVLFAVVLYLILGVAIKGFWGIGAYTIFPIMAVALYAVFSAKVLEHNVKLKRHYTTDLIIFSYGVILAIALFFVLWLAAGISPGITWVSFTYLPFWAVFSVAVTTFFLRKKRITLFIAPMLVTLGVPVYLTAAAVTGLWHPLWIIIVIAVLASLVYVIFALNSKIRKSEEAHAEKEESER